LIKKCFRLMMVTVTTPPPLTHMILCSPPTPLRVRQIFCVAPIKDETDFIVDPRRINHEDYAGIVSLNVTNCNSSATIPFKSRKRLDQLRICGRLSLLSDINFCALPNLRILHLVLFPFAQIRGFLREFPKSLTELKIVSCYSQNLDEQKDPILDLNCLCRLENLRVLQCEELEQLHISVSFSDTCWCVDELKAVYGKQFNGFSRQSSDNF
jgi:hypothetical protein